MKEDFFSVNFLIAVALVLSIGLVVYNAFLIPEYAPVGVSYMPEETTSNSSSSASDNSDKGLKKDPEAKVSLNIATSEELQTISGIGPVMSKKILQYRDKVGVINSLDELMNIDGIGEATYDKIAPHFVLD